MESAVTLTPASYRRFVVKEVCIQPSVAAIEEAFMTGLDRGGMAVASIEIGREMWVVVPPSTISAVAEEELRDALVSALDRGARNLVIDFANVGEISREAADVLSSVAQTLIARGGCLWLANLAADHSFPIVRVDGRGLDPLAGLNPALDAALFPADTGGRGDAQSLPR
jgi:hypothetical protein